MAQSQKDDDKTQLSKNLAFISHCTDLCLFGFIRHHNSKWKLPIAIDIELLLRHFLGAMPMSFNYHKMRKYLAKKNTLCCVVQPLQLYLAFNAYTQTTLEAKLLSLKQSLDIQLHEEFLRAIEPRIGCRFEVRALNTVTFASEKFICDLYDSLIHGSIQKLVSNKWKTVGIGKMELIENQYNPKRLLVKLTRRKNEKVYMFQCKPKHKIHQNVAIIIRGTDTINGNRHVLALRFNQQNVMNAWQQKLIQQIEDNKALPTRCRWRARTSHWVTAEMRKDGPWKCTLCLHANGPERRDCAICYSPRLKKEINDTNREDIDLGVEI